MGNMMMMMKQLANYKPLHHVKALQAASRLIGALYGTLYSVRETCLRPAALLHQ
jgi:hypothetical protein